MCTLPAYVGVGVGVGVLLGVGRNSLLQRLSGLARIAFVGLVQPEDVVDDEDSADDGRGGRPSWSASKAPAGKGEPAESEDVRHVIAESPLLPVLPPLCTCWHSL